MKTIFEKAYVIKAQAEKAAEKEFGADWAASYQIITNGKQFKIEALPAPMPEHEVKMLDLLGAFEPKGNVSLAEALAESGETLADLIEDGHSGTQADADRLANAQMSGEPGKPRFSSVKSPVKRVWHIADAMPKASRKEVVEECIRQGVAYGTARTQYQAWFKASQECERADIRKPYEKSQKDGE